MDMAKLIFAKDGSICPLKEGTELRQLAHLPLKTPIKFGCCQGLCGACVIKIRIEANNLSPKTKQEKETLARLKLEQHRLACQCAILGDTIIE